ncbi:phosphotransferase, partial [Mycolicibacterium litorale]|uniref:phosphotransferase n=1 Tax=Mycolicibacterium litorale TaxID=758802 RepID=UPI0039A3775A
MTAGRTAGFNFLEQPALPAPQVSEADAQRIAATHYGVEGDAVSLGSQQDKNFLVRRGGTAEVVGVLKVANPAFSDVELAAQDAAAKLIADTEPELRIAVPVPNRAGAEVTTVDGLLVRLLRYLPGGTLIDADHLGPAAVAGLGDVAARVSRALTGFDHEGLDRVLQWDPRYGADVVAALVGHVGDPAQRERLQTATDEAWERITRVAGDLPRQAVHLDITDANVVVSPAADGSRRPDGVIDFGDLTNTWAVAELAIAASSVLGRTGTEPVSILPAVRAFHALRPLTAAEVDALWPMVVLRTAVLIVSGAQQAQLDPDNAYVTEQSDGEWRMFEQATSVPVDVMTAVIRADLGLAAPPADVETTVPMLAAVAPEDVVTLDLSPTSDAYDFAFTPGGWLQSDVEDRLARDAVRDGAAAVVTRFGQPRLGLAPALSQRSAEVVPTGVRLWPAQALTLVAPWDGEVVTG